MALELSTAGILVKYCVEASVSGGRPTSGYTTIPGIKELPELDSAPESLEVTDLSDTTWKRYIPGLKDAGSAIALTANGTTAFKTAWETLCTSAATAIAAGKRVYFEYYVPSFGSFYFTGVPASLGFHGASVDAVFELNAYITPNEIVGWDTSSTAAQ